MLFHFVRKDARNWEEYVPYAIMAYQAMPHCSTEYVPYAVMAYRAMPHCSTEYSPYYLFYGIDMWLQIEDFHEI
jgi:mannitol/fructose-specific phosphotransferase system IIA component (Ntr-type)